MERKKDTFDFVSQLKMAANTETNRRKLTANESLRKAYAFVLAFNEAEKSAGIIPEIRALLGDHVPLKGRSWLVDPKVMTIYQEQLDILDNADFFAEVDGLQQPGQG